MQIQSEICEELTPTDRYGVRLVEAMVDSALASDISAERAHDDALTATRGGSEPLKLAVLRRCYELDCELARRSGDAAPALDVWEPASHVAGLFSRALARLREDPPRSSVPTCSGGIRRYLRCDEAAAVLGMTRAALVRRLQRAARASNDPNGVVWLGCVEARKLGAEWRLLIHWQCPARCAGCTMGVDGDANPHDRSLADD